MGLKSKIVFLGTGGDSISVGKQLRGAGGIIVQVGENQFHIDPGPCALFSAKQCGINIRENTAVLVSHGHLNHCNDVNAIINAMTYGGMDRKGVLIGSKTLIEGFDGEAPYVTNFHRKCVEKTIMIEPDKRVGVNDAEVVGVEARHTDPNTVGFKIYTHSFLLGYTSDTEYFKELPGLYKGCDILIVNVQLPNDSKKEGWMNTDDAIKLVKEVKPKLAIITHFGVKMLDSDIIEQARKIQKESSVQTVAANDGLAITPTSYQAGLKTKTLNLY